MSSFSALTLLVCEGTCLLVNNIRSILKTRPIATKYSSDKLGHTAYVLDVASFERSVEGQLQPKNEITVVHSYHIGNCANNNKKWSE